jgi:hypothetical protein
MRRTKQAVVIAAALALAANVGFLGGQLRAQPDAEATQAQARAAQASEVRVLQSIDRRLRGIQRSLGTVSSLGGEDDVVASLSKINDNIGDFDYTGNSLHRNTREAADTLRIVCIAVASSPSSC